MPTRNGFLGKLALTLALLAAPLALADDRDRAGWVATWATGPAGPFPGGTPQFNDQTVRYILHTSAGGDSVRVKISNTFGDAPLVIGGAHIAHRKAGAAIVPGSDRRLTSAASALLPSPRAGWW